MKGSCLNCRYVRNMHYPVYTIFDRISWPWLRISFELMDDSRVRITRICCFYCCRGCCNDDIRRYLFLTERFEIRFEVNQLIEEKLTRGGKKKRRRKSLSFRSNASFPFVASFAPVSACFGFRKRNRRKGGNASVPQGAL